MMNEYAETMEQHWDREVEEQARKVSLLDTDLIDMYKSRVASYDVCVTEQMRRNAMKKETLNES